jgi:ATP-dependent DNA helicase RecQ
MPTLATARATLTQYFGYADFRPGQTEAIRQVLSRRDVLVVLPTGGGKSLCYQVPALVQGGLTVVLSPLISLMQDQVDALTRREIPATYLNSTLSPNEVNARWARVERGEIRLLYLAPERFEGGRTADRLARAGVRLLAVDEAHCISEWGHDFRPSYRRVSTIRDAIGGPPTLALTATATPEVRQDVVAQLRLRNAAVIVAGFDRVNLTYRVRPAPDQAAKDEGVATALRAMTSGVAVVYASTRREVERVAHALRRKKVKAQAYHAGLEDRERARVQDGFMNESFRAIVATSAFGMGIDKPNVRLVVHHAMPGTLEAYYQEAGRAGRDGNPASCLLLHAHPDRFTHEFFIRTSHPERAHVEAVWTRLRAIAAADGSIRATADDIAAGIPKGNLRVVERALRLFVDAGALLPSAAEGARAWVRLLAAPERIRETYGHHDSLELGLLRALWSGTRGRIADGASVDLAGLPPGLGSPMDVARTLDALQARQFVSWARASSAMRLLAEQPAVDWASLNRRRATDTAKLDAMQRYAYATGCRRRVLLAYFGDADAQRRANCGACDRCLGEATGARGSARTAQRVR